MTVYMLPRIRDGYDSGDISWLTLLYLHHTSLGKTYMVSVRFRKSVLGIGATVASPSVRFLNLDCGRLYPDVSHGSARPRTCRNNPFIFMLRVMLILNGILLLG